MARYAAAAISSTPTEYAKFLIEVIAPRPADTFRLTAASLKGDVSPAGEGAQHVGLSRAWMAAG